jgi:hypothetical protein
MPQEYPLSPPQSTSISSKERIKGMHNIIQNTIVLVHLLLMESYSQAEKNLNILVRPNRDMLSEWKVTSLKGNSGLVVQLSDITGTRLLRGTCTCIEFAFNIACIDSTATPRTSTTFHQPCSTIPHFHHRIPSEQNLHH